MPGVRETASAHGRDTGGDGYRPRVYRSRSNLVAGLATSFGLFGFFCWLDPFLIWSPWEGGDALPTKFESLTFCLPFFLLSVFTAAFFARPRVEVTAQTVIVRNPVRDTVAPLGSVHRIDYSGTFARLLLGDRTVWALGLERSPTEHPVLLVLVPERATPQTQHNPWSSGGVGPSTTSSCCSFCGPPSSFWD
jgi:PH (Pleckstrin Homology) domain-containing protein